MRDTQQSRPKVTYTLAIEKVDFETWAVLNAIKGSRAFYVPARDHYVEAVTKTSFDKSVIGDLSERGLIEMNGGLLAASYQLTDAGDQAWRAFAGDVTSIEGECYICEGQRELAPHYIEVFDRFVFVCGDCSLWPSLEAEPDEDEERAHGYHI